MTQCGTDNYMAPELKGEQKEYAGPPVDIFAMGAMLFLMSYARFAFIDCTDVHFRRLLKNPALAMKQKKLSASKEFLDLLVGMLQPDPAKRFTMDQIKNHAWLKGETAETATPEQVKEHFYKLKESCGMANAEKEAALQKYVGEGMKVNRGHGAPAAQGPDEDELKDWEDLKYKEFDPFESQSMTGFYTQTFGAFVFKALWEYLASAYKIAKPAVSSKSWKMNFTITE